MANNSINLATLDFETIKANLKNHLRSQAIFKDYDFDGSNISVILDILSYNTSLNSYYMNMLSSESFLDSAQLRSSVLSHAKELNYRPRSARSSKAVVSLMIQQRGSGTLTLPKGSTFTSTFNFKTYTFSTDEAKVYFGTYDSTSDLYTFDTGEINIYEGFYVTENFVVDYNNERQRFIISNDMIDTNSLIVNSIENGGSTIISYRISDTLLGLDKNSNNFFLQATEGNKYEILFGDDIIARRPKNGSTIQIQYRISQGSDANGATSFTIDTDPTSDNSGNVSVRTVTKALGGDYPESITSIKLNAPRHFQTQQRAVTTEDYETLLKSQFPEIVAISVYGGDQVSPPQYGKVFIALSISNVDGIPQSKKSEYESYIKPKMSGPIHPVFVDPDYLYCRVDSRVKYNLNTTTLRPDEIRLLVSNQINNYNRNNLNNFNVTMYNSKFTRSIDDSHPSIMSNDTQVFLYKKINPILNTPQNIDIEFGCSFRDDIPEIDVSHLSNELRTVFSSRFTFNGESCIIEDDGVGGLRIMRISEDVYSKVQDVGSVDYSTGKIQIINFNISRFEGNNIRLYAMPSSRDITSSKNDILNIEMSEVNINIEAIRA